MRESIAPMHATDPLDAVLIETSGMADPEAIGKLMGEHGLNQWFEINRIVTIVSPQSFLKLKDNLPVVERQVQHSDLIILNKIDLADEEQITETEAAVRALAPLAEQIRAQHADAIFEFTQPRDALPNEDLAPCSANPFSTQTWSFKGICRIEDMEAWLAQIPSYVMRAKGHLQTRSGWYLIEKTVDNCTVSSCDPQDESCVVFVVHDDYEGALNEWCRELTVEYSALNLL